MKHALTMIVAYCILMSFNGCAKIRGERIEFGHNFPCKVLRGNVYYITFPDDAVIIKNLKQRVAEEGHTCNLSPDYEYVCKSSSIAHLELLESLFKYREGFFGWF